jgi:hypothetical protein
MSRRKLIGVVSACIIIVIVVVVVVVPALAPDAYELTIDSTDGGTVSEPGEGTSTYDAGTVVDLVASPESGYEFVSWSGDVDTVADVDGPSTTITMNGSYSVTAEFEVSDDTGPGLPPQPDWNPQKQALLPAREFDTEWAIESNWYPGVHRGISAIAGSEPTMIASPDNANVSTMLGLSEGHPPGDGPRILRCIFAKNLPGGVPLDLIVRLYDEDTLIGEWLEQDIPAVWTAREYELDDDPSDWSGLRVELTRQGETTAPEADLRQALVSLVEMEIPYPETFIFPYLNPATTTHTPGSDTIQCPPGVQEGDVILVCGVDGEAADGFTLIYSQPTSETASPTYVMRTWWKRAGPD